MSIEVRNINKTFNNQFKALTDVNLMVETGELVALLGPSGSGKTTLLRIIAGLEQADPGGQILLWDEDVATYHVSARKVGFVFQHYALFKHMTVFENVAFGLRARPWRQRPGRSEIKDRVLELLRLVQLDGFARRYPSQLSGGQRQRVALARALAVQPKVLLLDEPFGALDAKVRRELRRWLRKLHDEVHITSVFVTHDQEEALEVSDRIAVMNKGRIEQVGSPEDVYDNPANPFVYNFLGNVNLFHARLEGSGSSELAGGRAAERPAQLAYVRPHDVDISRDEPEDDGAIAAVVEHVGFAGAVVNVSLRRVDDGQTVEAELTRDRHRELGLKQDDRVYVRMRNARVFAAEDYSI
jgi:sulfate transport system ATP-binding protein